MLILSYSNVSIIIKYYIGWFLRFVIFFMTSIVIIITNSYIITNFQIKIHKHYTWRSVG